MEFPDRDVAMAWVGRTLVDRDGAEIGACTAVFTDDGTQLTEWVCSELAGAAVFIPAVGAAESSGKVQVAVRRADIADAPRVGGPEHISTDEEAALYRHYGIPHSRDASPTVLPTGDVETPAPDTAPNGAPDPFPAAPVEPVAAAPVEPVTAPVEPVTAWAAEEPVTPAQPAADAGQLQPEESAAAPSGRRRIASALGGLAAVGVALGVVLRMRRPRRRPPTRAERLAERGRATYAALGARTAAVASSAAPLLETSKEVVRRRPRAGAAAAGVPAAALAVAAVRRRRSRQEPDDLMVGRS